MKSSKHIIILIVTQDDHIFIEFEWSISARIYTLKKSHVKCCGMVIFPTRLFVVTFTQNSFYRL